MMSTYLQQLAMQQSAALGRSYSGLGQLLGVSASGSMMENAYRNCFGRNAYPESTIDKPKDIRSELQQEVNKWLSDVDL